MLVGGFLQLSFLNEIFPFCPWQLQVCWNYSAVSLNTGANSEWRPLRGGKKSIYLVEPHQKKQAHFLLHKHKHRKYNSFSGNTWKILQTRSWKQCTLWTQTQSQAAVAVKHQQGEMRLLQSAFLPLSSHWQGQGSFACFPLQKESLWFVHRPILAQAFDSSLIVANKQWELSFVSCISGLPVLSLNGKLVRSHAGRVTLR